MAKTLIIADIHNNFVNAEAIICKENPDHIIFLGDNFDRLHDIPEHAYQTAQWLRRSLEEKNRTHLIGNHDLAYMSTLESLKYKSGHTRWKDKIINNVMGDSWKKMRFYCWIHDWLCTHSGLTKNFFKQFNTGLTVEQFMSLESIDAKEAIEKGWNHRLFQSSHFRGGSYGTSGILWCDFKEFEPIKGLNQIFGHSPAGKPRIKQKSKSTNICLDCRGRFYAVYENDKMETKSTKNLNGWKK